MTTKPRMQGRNEVYEIRDQRPEKGRCLESQRLGSGSAIFFMESGIKNLIIIGIRDQNFG